MSQKTIDTAERPPLLTTIPRPYCCSTASERCSTASSARGRFRPISVRASRFSPPSFLYSRSTAMRRRSADSLSSAWSSVRSALSFMQSEPAGSTSSSLPPRWVRSSPSSGSSSCRQQQIWQDLQEKIRMPPSSLSRLQHLPSPSLPRWHSAASSPSSPSSSA